jgi:hypothetical protein
MTILTLKRENAIEHNTVMFFSSKYCSDDKKCPIPVR